MTPEQATSFLERELPGFKKRFCKTDLDEDAVQIACMTFLNKADKLTDADNPLHYLFGIYRHKRLRLYEHYNKHLMYCGEVTEHANVNFAPAYPYTSKNVHADSALQERAREYLGEVVNKRHRRMCELYFIEGYDTVEIAKIMKIARPRVSAYITLSVKRIQKILRERGEL